MNQNQALNSLAFSRVVAESISNRLNVLVRLSDLKSVGFGSMHVFRESNLSDKSLLDSVIGSNWSIDNRTVWSNATGKSSGYPDYVMTLGIDDLVNPIKRFLLPYEVSIASVMVCAGHEERHVLQYEAARGRCVQQSDMPSLSLLSLVVSQHNSEFYRNNYSMMLHEIDAERYGVGLAYQTLSSNSNISNVDSVMIDTFKWFSLVRSGPVNYGFIDSVFDESMVINRIDDCFESAILSIRNRQSLFTMAVDDFATSYFERNPDDIEVFKSLQYGYEQDAYLAMISLKYHPEDSKFFDIAAIKYPENMPIPNGMSPVRGVNATSDLLPELVCDDIIMNTDDIEFDDFDL